MSAVCECNALYEDDDFDLDQKASSSGPSIIVDEIVDFGKVAVGKKAYSLFEIENTTSASQEYLVFFDQRVNPIFRPFDFTYNRLVEAGQNLRCKISYAPLFACSVNVDYIYVQEACSEVCTLSLRGESVGPRVEISTAYLTFSAVNGKRSVEHTIELSNKGNVEASYQFDVTDAKTGLYSLSKDRGIIAANKHQYITITFKPREEGIYCESLPLLILHHKPRIIQLVGIYIRREVSNLHIKHYNFDFEEKDDYTGYLYDVLTVMTNPPPFNLSDVYLNFDSIDLDSKSETSKTLVTTLTNHMSEEIEVEWYEVKGSCFTMRPNASKIAAFGSCVFECKFTPTVADQFYCQVLSGGVYWIDPRTDSIDNDCYANAPIPAHLRLFGHSFPHNKRWIPQLTMPDTVILPPCYPNSKSVTTFTLTLTGYLPVSFRFIPPRHSKFIVKPMMGVVENFQIVVAFIQCGQEHQKVFVERWSIELNGLTQMRSIFLKGYCEEPSVKIGTDNKIRFPPVHPQCQERKTVQVHNHSVHCVKYHFHLEEESDLLKVDYPEGILASNEVIKVNWTCTGHPPTPRIYNIICEIRILSDMAMIGKPYEVPVKIYTTCEYSELCSMPNRCNFYKLQVGNQHTFRFNLFNFGTSSIHFKLLFWDKQRPDFDDNCLNVVPNQSTLKPKERMEVLLYLKCNLFGNFNVHIYYQTRVSKESPLVINSNELCKIFAFKFTTAYPTIQIVDIYRHNFGPLFSKAALWDIFNISKINFYLRTMKRKQTKDVTVLLPESLCMDDVFNVVLLLKNDSPFDTLLLIKRNKVCDCPLIGKSKSLTFRTRAFDCKHRSLFSMTLSGELFQANAYQTLEMNARYEEVGLIHMSYTFNLSHSRVLQWNIFLNTLPDNISWPSKYLEQFHLKLGTVCVSDEQPPVKAFWFYNNTGNSVFYRLSVASAKDSTHVMEFPLLECFNPSGMVKPYTAAPVLFRFRPLECKSYNFSFPITLGESTYAFKLSGNGFVKHKGKLPNVHSHIKANSNQLNDIYFSDEHISICPLPVWSKTETVFFVRNVSEHNIIGYSFQRSFVEGIVEIKVINSKGVLKPKESHMVTIEIISFDQPCMIRIQLTCKFLNHTQYYKYRQSSLLHCLKQEDIKKHFIITEKGTQYPPNEVVVEPMPLNFFKTISLDISIISAADIDMVLDSESQLTHLPQFMLTLNPAKISEGLIAKQKERTIKSHYASKVSVKIKTDAKETKKPCEGVDIENAQIMRDAIDCMITHVLNGNIFHKILLERRNQNPPYYIQVKSSYNKSPRSKAEQPEQLLEDSITNMQAPLITEIFQKLIHDSIHTVFRLGSRGTGKIDIDHVYHSKYKCKNCTERSCTK